MRWRQVEAEGQPADEIDYKPHDTGYVVIAQKTDRRWRAGYRLEGESRINWLDTQCASRASAHSLVVDVIRSLRSVPREMAPDPAPLPSTPPEIPPPEITLPEITLPEITLPEITSPEITSPQITPSAAGPSELEQIEAILAPITERIAISAGQLSEDEMAFLERDADIADIDVAQIIDTIRQNVERLLTVETKLQTLATAHFSLEADPPTAPATEDESLSRLIRPSSTLSER